MESEAVNDRDSVPAKESLPISALQHWLFCPRQCALIHVERVWEENRFTAEGRILHERADGGRADRRDGVRVLRSVHVSSTRLGIHGVADVVEMHGTRPYPVEYKRGRPKAHHADEVQLCAQALCLEEMTGQSIQEGALFYGRNRRRKRVALDDDLRALTHRIAQDARAAMDAGSVPAAIHDPAHCNACSLADLCRPEARRDGADAWLVRRLARSGIPE